MADERIEVEWIATANQMVGVLSKIEQRFEKQEQALQKLAQTSNRSAESAAGSFNKLEQELKQNEAQLKKMTIGTAEWAAQKSKVDALRKSMAGAKADMQSAGDGLTSSLKSGLASMTQLAVGMIGFQQVVTAVVEELNKAKQIQLDSATATRSVEQAVAAMAPNIGAENVVKARQMITSESAGLGVTQEGLANLLASGISGGAKDLDEALSLASKTLMLTAGDAKAAQPLMSGMLSLAATTGNRNFDQILGQLSQFQKAGRGEDMAMSVNNMATAMAAANIKGQRVEALGGERTLELGAAISQILQDPTMAVTGTTLRQLMTKMDSFIPATSATLDDGTKSTLTKEAVESFNQLKTVDARMEAMQKNSELAKQFLSKIEDNQGKAAVRALVTGEAGAMDKLRTAEGIITGGDAAKGEFANLIAEIGKQTIITRVEALSQANLQSLEVNEQKAAAGEARKVIDDTLKKVNLSGLDFDTSSKLENEMRLGDVMGASPARTAIETLQSAKQDRKLFGFIPAGGSISQEEREIIDRQIKVLELLEATIDKKFNNTLPAARPKEAALPAATVP